MVGSNWTWTRGLVVAGTLVASVLMGSNVMAAEETAEPQSAGLNFNPFDLPENFGWLSDPEVPAENISDALFGGKFSLNNRLRWEHVAQTRRDETSAITNRTRFGYGTKELNGLSFYAELENNTPFDRSDHGVPQAAQGDSGRGKAVIADPEEVELNQAYIKYVYQGDIKLDVIAGRQRIILDDARFVGNVGWRQMEQTFDAVRVNTDLGIENFNLTYVYIWKVNTIFTEEAAGLVGVPARDNGPLDSQTHLINTSYKFCDALKLTGFAYLFDLSNATVGDPASNATYGVTASGKVAIDDTFSTAYSLTYATQSDYADNATSYSADFFAADGKLVAKDLGFGGVGYQKLGSDNGTAAFQTPAGTNHAFQGWADVFLTTPITGLQDLYVYAGTTLPCGTKVKITYHDFDVAKGGDLGSEIDVVLSKKINKNWSVLSKLASYNGGSSANADRTKFILETTFSF